ncbi:MAG TPA: hypothetical protein VGG56_09660 [Terracidiphilus sp.]|jgi:hypothetical protein
MNHRSVNRRASQKSPRQADRPEGTGFSTKLESKTERKQPFVEDFNMEHSCGNVAVALIAFSAAADSMESGTSRNQRAYSMNVPSCVYLG